MKRIFSLFLTGALLIATTGCHKPEQTYSATQLLLDTAVQITLQSGGSEAILNECFARCRKYEALFSTTLEGSDIARINAAGGQPVTVDDETAALLRLACEYSAQSNGVFDLTVYPAKRLWDFKAETPHLPDAAALAAAVKNIDYTHISVNGNTVTASGGAQVDLGGIAKGYIADRLREYLEEQKVGCAIINLGGNVCCVGEKAEGFRIGVKRPYTADDVLEIIRIDSGAVVTSGCYERYFTLDGKEYHHILDTSTGYPVENDLAGVTILCENAAMADYLSTTVYALGYEQGLAFLKDKPAEAVFVFRDDSVRLSDGLTYAQDGTIIYRS